MRRKITVLIVISAAFACLLIWNLMPRASAWKAGGVSPPPKFTPPKRDPYSPQKKIF